MEIQWRNFNVIVASYSKDTESFSCESELELDEKIQNIALKSNSIGYVLLSLLNIDFEKIADIIYDAEWAENDNVDIDCPVNVNEIYNRLLLLSDVFKLYSNNEWEAIHHDLATVHEGVAFTVRMLKKYISCCERKKVPYLNQFFFFLVGQNYFDVDYFSIVPIQNLEFSDRYLDSLLEEVSAADGVDELDELYDAFVNGREHDDIDLNVYSVGSENRFQKIVMISFTEIAKRSKSIRKCKNCGKYFIPNKRADALYCDNPSPEIPGMTCKEYGTKRLWYARQKEDELATLSRKIASAKGMLAKRNPDIPQYAESYNYFRKQRLAWTKAVKEGKKTKDEYREWLLYMQSQKRIKEASRGND